MGTTKPTTTKDALIAVQECLEDLCHKIGTKPMQADPALQKQLEYVVSRQDETIELLQQMNGNVRKHGETLAEHGQWMKDHDANVHPALEKQVESTANRTTTFAWIDTALSLLAGILAGLKHA
jgi:hypothetical protein